MYSSLQAPRVAWRPLLTLFLIPLLVISISLITRWDGASGAENGISCEANPFGSYVDVFPENEVFVSLTSTFGMDPNLTAMMADIDIGGGGNTSILEAGLFYEDGNPLGYNIQEHAAAAADLNGDGLTDFVQAFVNGNGAYYLAHHDPLSAPLGDVTYVGTGQSGNSYLAASSGNLIGEDSEREQVVAVSKYNGAVQVLLYEDDPNIGGPLNQFASWSSSSGLRQNGTLLDVAVGNFNRNPQQDIAVALYNNNTVEILILEYQPGSGLQLLESATQSVVEPIDLQVAAARLDGGFQDELVLAVDKKAIDSSLATQIEVHVFSYDHESDELDSEYVWVDDTYSSNFGLGAGDVNGNIREEIVLVYPSAGGDGLENALYVDVLELKDLDTPDSYLDRYAQSYYPWTGPGEGRTQAEYISVAVDDIDIDDDLNEGAKLTDEIVIALDDGRGLEIIYVDHAMLLSSSTILPVEHFLNLDPNDLNSKTDIVLGDYDNDSIKGEYDGACESVTDRRVLSAMYTPPIWPNIQNGGLSSAFFGRSQSSSHAEEKAMSYSRSHTTSGYVGVGVSASYGVGSFEASVRGTASQTYGSSNVRSSEVMTSEVSSVQHFGYEDFATVEHTNYHCFSYDVVGIEEHESANFYHCEYIDSAQQPVALEAWHSFYGKTEANSDAKLAVSWAPVARDWASLALFRTAYASQSSTSQAAGLAVDGDYQTVAETGEENDPYWEIDLGESKALQQVRIWNGREADGCISAASCPDLLNDFYLFVSDEPFASDDPDVLLADANVQAYSLSDISDALPPEATAGPAGDVTTFLTLDDGNGEPNSGRYVRVQINRDSAVLTLAEVQVFGADPLSPDRHPTDVKDDDEGDGYFEVQLFNPYSDSFEYVDARGRLLWDGDDQASSNSHLVGQLISVGGNTLTYWSYGQEYGLSESRAESFSWDTTMGYEVSGSAGAIVQVEAGYGEEWSSGVTRENTHTASWGESFEMGGGVPHFPSNYSGAGANWILNCAYQMRPFYYELTEESSFGIESRYPVLDYLVPHGTSSNQLNRRDGDLPNCRNGNQTADEPTATNDGTNMTTGNSLTFAPLANDFGNNLTITNVTDPKHGQALINGRFIHYTPNSGFVGEDSFEYTISDGTLDSTSKVEIVVEPQWIFLPQFNRR